MMCRTQQFKINDTVRLTKKMASCIHTFKVGTIVKITSIHYKYGYSIEDQFANILVWAGWHGFVKIKN